MLQSRGSVYTKQLSMHQTLLQCVMAREQLTARCWIQVRMRSVRNNISKPVSRQSLFSRLEILESKSYIPCSGHQLLTFILLVQVHNLNIRCSSNNFLAKTVVTVMCPLFMLAARSLKSTLNVFPIIVSKVHNINSRQPCFYYITLAIILIIMFIHYNLNLGSCEVTYKYMNVDKPDNLNIYTHHKRASTYITFYMLK